MSNLLPRNQGGGGYGQNLASAGSSGDISGLKLKSGLSGVTDQWYNGEVANYNAFYGLPNPPSSVPLGKFGHFTQLVWKSSTKVGCATVQCPAGTVLGLPSWYTVCNYSPPGKNPHVDCQKPLYASLTREHRQLRWPVRQQRPSAPRTQPFHCITTPHTNQRAVRCQCYFFSRMSADCN